MPVMKVALQNLDPVFVGVGRFLVALLPAVITLLILKAPLPNGRQFLTLLTIVGCLVFGFSWPFAEALIQAPSHHAAVIAGSIPLVVALTAAVRGRERLPRSFWMAAAAGTLTVVGYGLLKSSWHFNRTDLFLIAGSIAGGVGYAEGGRLGKEMGSLAVTCWVPVVAAPFALLVCAPRMPEGLQQVPAAAWWALGYNGVFSCWLGFVFWNRGMGLGGIARIGQLQLLQPFLTLLFVASFFRESLSARDWIAAGAVVCCVAMAQSKARSAGSSKEGRIPPFGKQPPAPKSVAMVADDR